MWKYVTSQIFPGTRKELDYGKFKLAHCQCRGPMHWQNLTWLIRIMTVLLFWKFLKNLKMPIVKRIFKLNHCTSIYFIYYPIIIFLFTLQWHSFSASDGIAAVEFVQSNIPIYLFVLKWLCYYEWQNYNFKVWLFTINVSVHTVLFMYCVQDNYTQIIWSHFSWNSMKISLLGSKHFLL